jgi:soluble lytic murein transglycosylase-like protein
MKKKLFVIVLSVISIGLCSWFSYNNFFRSEKFVNFPESVKMYFYIEKYSKEYGIPRNIAYGIPYYETNYKGPTDTTYNPKRTSKSKAYGAMQLKLKTANAVCDSTITKKQLLNNTELNVILSFKLLKTLHDKYGNWKLALGAYNTGKPVVNKYSKNISKFSLTKIVNTQNYLYATKN